VGLVQYIDWRWLSLVMPARDSGAPVLVHCSAVRCRERMGLLGVCCLAVCCSCAVLATTTSTQQRCMHCYVHHPHPSVDVDGLAACWLAVCCSCAVLATITNAPSRGVCIATYNIHIPRWMMMGACCGCVGWRRLSVVQLRCAGLPGKHKNINSRQEVDTCLLPAVVSPCCRASGARARSAP
jgi:hypothetical protein